MLFSQKQNRFSSPKSNKSLLHRIGGIALISLMISMMCGCSTSYGTEALVERRVDTAMGTNINQTIYRSEARSESDCEITEKIQNMLILLETNELSWRIQDSSVAAINASAGTVEGYSFHEDEKLLAETMRALEISKVSCGALDLTISPIARLWDIGGQSPRIPSDAEINETLAYVDYEQIEVSQNNIRLPLGFSLDYGAIGKGIACDRAVDILKNEPVEGAIISVGGSVVTYGNKPDKTPWKVAVADPDRPADYVGVVSLQGNHYISTSGDYEKYITAEDGSRYCHILDPATGQPACRDSVRSVTIVADSGLDADALSTACFVLGEKEGLKLADSYKAAVLYIKADGSYVQNQRMQAIFQRK